MITQFYLFIYLFPLGHLIISHLHVLGVYVSELPK